ncbi:unnamed protein product [Schistocephalus solidus]|uniref:Vacuolar protein sorting-associated protein 51 homolog n=1 Tax=Schistocephalus solidus TaxID=70667 RepID=A0A183T5C1_SCHSO|nr:unnamed protein product [Schistocephalus solidus]
MAAQAEYNAAVIAGGTNNYSGQILHLTQTYILLYQCRSIDDEKVSAACTKLISAIEEAKKNQSRSRVTLPGSATPLRKLSTINISAIFSCIPPIERRNGVMDEVRRLRRATDQCLSDLSSCGFLTGLPYILGSELAQSLRVLAQLLRDYGGSEKLYNFVGQIDEHIGELQNLLNKSELEVSFSRFLLGSQALVLWHAFQAQFTHWFSLVFSKGTGSLLRNLTLSHPVCLSAQRLTNNKSSTVDFEEVHRRFPRGMCFASHVGFVLSILLREFVADVGVIVVKPVLVFTACASEDFEGGGMDEVPQMTPSCTIIAVDRVQASLPLLSICDLASTEFTRPTMSTNPLRGALIHLMYKQSVMSVNLDLVRSRELDPDYKQLLAELTVNIKIFERVTKLRTGIASDLSECGGAFFLFSRPDEEIIIGIQGLDCPQPLLNDDAETRQLADSICAEIFRVLSKRRDLEQTLLKLNVQQSYEQTLSNLRLLADESIESQAKQMSLMMEVNKSLTIQPACTEVSLVKLVHHFGVFCRLSRYLNDALVYLPEAVEKAQAFLGRVEEYVSSVRGQLAASPETEVEVEDVPEHVSRIVVESDNEEYGEV